MEAESHVKCTVNIFILRTTFFILHVNDHKRGVKTCEIFDKFNAAQTCENYAQNLSTKFLNKNQLHIQNIYYICISYMCRRSADIVRE